MTSGTTLATIKTAIKIDASGSKPDQPVHLMRMVETMTPTLPNVSCMISSNISSEIWQTDGKNMEEDTAHIVGVGMVVSVGMAMGVVMVVVGVVAVVVVVGVAVAVAVRVAIRMIVRVTMRMIAVLMLVAMAVIIGMRMRVALIMSILTSRKLCLER